VSLAGTFEPAVTARAALRSPECRRVLRLLSLAGSMVTLPRLMSMAAEFEARSPAGPPRSSSAARHGTFWNRHHSGRGEALEHGFLTETLESRVSPGGRVGTGGGAPERGREALASRAPIVAAKPVAMRPRRPGRVTLERREGSGEHGTVAGERHIGFRHELIAEAIAADLLPATESPLPLRPSAAALAAEGGTHKRPPTCFRSRFTPGLPQG